MASARYLVFIINACVALRGKDVGRRPRESLTPYYRGISFRGALKLNNLLEEADLRAE
jgi:hypothetical protein